MVISKQYTWALVMLSLGSSHIVIPADKPASTAPVAALAVITAGSFSSSQQLLDSSSGSSTPPSRSAAFSVVSYASSSSSSSSTPPLSGSSTPRSRSNSPHRSMLHPAADARLIPRIQQFHPLDQPIATGSKGVFPAPLVQLIREYAKEWIHVVRVDSLHDGKPIHAGAWSPTNPHLFATAGGDRRIKITHARTQEPQTWEWEMPGSPKGFVEIRDTLEGHGAPVSTLSWHPNGNYLASGSSDANVIVWDTQTGRGERLFTQRGATVENSHPGQTVYTVAYNHDGSRLASGAGEFMRSKGSIAIWNPANAWSTATPKPHPLVRQLPNLPKAVTALAWLKHRPTQLVASAQDNTVRLYDTQTGQELQRLETGHSRWVRAMAVAPHTLFTGSIDGTVRLYDFVTGLPSGTLQSPGTEQILSIAHAPQDSEVATGGNNKVEIWNRTTGKIIQTIKLPWRIKNLSPTSCNAVNSITYNRDGTMLAVCDENGTVYVYDQIGTPLQPAAQQQQCPTPTASPGAKSWLRNPFK